MSKETNFENDLASIRNLMERSTRFISLSGLSGVLAGIYALAGSAVAYYLIYYPNSPFGYLFYYVNEKAVLLNLFLTALAVLVISVATAIYLTIRKSKKTGVSYWDHNVKRMLINGAIPLVAGGVLILVLLYRGYFGITAPASLIFYGLALISASNYTLGDIRYLGICEVVIGLICAIFPGYGLIFWALGFGILHIVYGTVMYNKYDK